MTRLFFGGSFNPLHVGHLLISRAVAEAKGFDRVVLVPSAQPPHKQRALDMVEPAKRLIMCQLVAADDPYFETSDVEIVRSGPSFTIDTVQFFQSQGERKINWLIGADMMSDLPNWRESRELLKHVDFWIARRPGFEIDWNSLPDEFRPLRRNVVNVPLIEISASQVRQRVVQGKTIRHLVPDVLERFIREQMLYQVGS